MQNEPSIEDQIAAVERAAANHRGHVDNLRDLIRKRRRPESDLQMAQSWLPALEFAARTMRTLNPETTLDTDVTK